MPITQRGRVFLLLPCVVCCAPLSRVWAVLSSRDQHVSPSKLLSLPKNKSKFSKSQGLKWFPYNHICIWPRLTLICPVYHCFGYAGFSDAFSTIQNIYFNFPFFLSFFLWLEKQFHTFFIFLLRQKLNNTSHFFFILTIYCIILKKILKNQCIDFILLKSSLILFLLLKSFSDFSCSGLWYFT